MQDRTDNSGKPEIRGPQAIDSGERDPFASPHKIGYARVSTADQNLELQIASLVRDGVKPEDIYQEKISGAAKKRPEFNRMMRELRPGDVITVWKLDRLGRTTRQVLDTIAIIHESGAFLRIITQHFDSTNPMGKAMLAICAIFSELERDLGVERTLAGLAAARARGRIGGRRVMYTDKQIEEAAERFRAGETLKVIRQDVKSRAGKTIGEAQLGRRIGAFEEKRKQDAERKCA
jgi:DNA invertase Pin-like site-specific DNA recombinase